MENDKRKGEQPVPDHFEELLNDMQLRALHQMENFGWELRFIRRPLFQEPVAVVYNAEGSKIGVLESDGRVNMDPDIEVRE